VFLATGLVGAAGVAAGAAGVESGVLPGRSWFVRHLGLDGPAGVIPDVAPGQLVSGSFTSRLRLGTPCGWSIAYPPGHSPDQSSGGGHHLPVLVVLHGASFDHTAAFGDQLGLDRFLAQAVNNGARPFAIASVDGGASYWHLRASGEDAGAMVSQEFIPLLHQHGLDTSKVGLLGWSMGGYGVLWLGGQLGARRVAAVAAESPAIWRDYGDSLGDAFDDAADFAAHTVFGRQKELTGIPLRIDCGTSDPFYQGTRDYVASFSPRPEGGFEPGVHDLDYWRRMAPAQMNFMARHLNPHF
jgi:dienelactone hydrolase